MPTTIAPGKRYKPYRLMVAMPPAINFSPVASMDVYQPLMPPRNCGIS
jgi:hypothetical protein